MTAAKLDDGSVAATFTPKEWHDLMARTAYQPGWPPGGESLHPLNAGDDGDCVTWAIGALAQSLRGAGSSFLSGDISYKDEGY